MKKAIFSGILGLLIFTQSFTARAFESAEEIYDQAFPVYEGHDNYTGLQVLGSGAEGFVAFTGIALLPDQFIEANSRFQSFLDQETRRLALEDLSEKDPSLAENVRQSDIASEELKTTRTELRQIGKELPLIREQIHVGTLKAQANHLAHYESSLSRQKTLLQNLVTLERTAKDAARLAEPGEEIISQLRSDMIALIKNENSAEFRSLLHRMRWTRFFAGLTAYTLSESIWRLYLSSKRRDPGFSPILNIAVESLLSPFQSDSEEKN